MLPAAILSLSLLPLALTLPNPSTNPTLPFTQIVAFGDNLSDNGNGSYAHNLTDPTHQNPKVYGFGTWTNGPVAISYLSTNLQTHLVADFAFGHADGGSKFGATIDNAYTKSPAGAPSSKDQIANYTGSLSEVLAGGGRIGQTLHFLWIGANDVNLYHFGVDQPTNEKFAGEFAGMLVQQVESLLSAGAQYVFVPGLYAKDISPSKKFYADTPAKVANMGSIIREANAAIESALSQFGGKVLYYDVYGFMKGLWTNATANGFTHVGDEFCDGYSEVDFQLCLVPAEQKEKFYWTQYLDMTTRVHELIAQDMAKVIQAHHWQ